MYQIKTILIYLMLFKWQLNDCSQDFAFPDDDTIDSRSNFRGINEFKKHEMQSGMGYPQYNNMPQTKFINSYGKTSAQQYTKNKDFKSLYGLKNGFETHYLDEKSCKKRPKQPINASLKCSSTTNTCKITCLLNYQFPSGDTSMFMSCIDGEWTIKDYESTNIPSCEPICSPPCLNNGFCLRPGECHCPDNFIGPQCELEKKLCVSPPPLPRNSKRSCSSTACSITCAKGYRFPDGSEITNMICKEGVWTPTRHELSVIPDCQPVCTPNCQNGGHCLSYNVCQCPPDYRGPQCQYNVDVCSPKRMLFNGAYNCSGDNDKLQCILTCPAGVELEYTAAPFYTCYYEKGEFEPYTIPQCQYSPDMEIIPLGGTSKTFFQSMDKSIAGGSHNIKKTKKKVYIQDNDEEEDDSWEKIITKTKIKIKKKSKKPAKKGYYEVEEEEADDNEYGSMEMGGVYSMYLTNDVNFMMRTPKPAVCMTWNGNKIKTFDGLMYNTNLYCSHTLVQDYIDGSFSIILRSCPYTSNATCSYALSIFLQDLKYTFDVEDGLFRLFSTKKQLPIPAQLSGLRVTLVGHKLNVALESVGITLSWDGLEMISIEATAGLWNRTAGLCGTMDQNTNNDFMSKDGSIHKLASTFIDSWEAPAVDLDKDLCKMDPKIKAELQLDCPEQMQENALRICQKLIENTKFTDCLMGFEKESLLKVCLSDYCHCTDTLNPTKCACDGISIFAKDCQFRGIMLDNGWRDLEICPISCKNGRIYKPCGPSFEPSCGSTSENLLASCNEGCFCPSGTLQYDGKCIQIEQCPCTLRGKTFKPGNTISKDCNTCTCQNGVWKCSDLTCGARCSAIGDPHYSTFDGKRYDFMGKCSYYLLKTPNITIEAENVACPGSISEAMNYITVDMPSCTKSVTINILDDVKQPIKSIKLKQGRQILVDGFEIQKLPIKVLDSIRIRQASSTMTLVIFSDDLHLWWDGLARLYIDAPAEYRGITSGLCGTFDANIQNDFLSPEGDIESSVPAFANKWRTKDTCDYISNNLNVPHPCHLNIENKEKALQICEKLKDKIFEDCHWSVDPEPFYEDCMYDVCACKEDIGACMCPVFSAYANECARQGSVIDWRYKVNECAIKCPAGQIFEECGDECYRSCEDIQFTQNCKSKCVEGCRCPAGQSLDEHNECIPTSLCPCQYKGLVFLNGYKEVRPGNKYLELCTCSGAKWKCIEATDLDKDKYPPAADLQSRCLQSKNEEFTTCEPLERKTCKNMHSYQESSAADCHVGCVCKPEYVFDSIENKCVLPKDCSCHHGSKSFIDGEKIKSDCNSCICKSGKWDCTEEACPAICTTWGDSHFETFDGKDFDFQGACNYVLSKGMLDGGEGYTITIQNVLCGSLGVTCSKSVTISIVGAHPESITLGSDGFERDSFDLTKFKNLDKLSVHRAGIFVVVEAAGMGLQVKWDRGTRVYIQLTVRWKGRVQGLCGNFNNDAQDDLKTPSSGIETSAVIFGDSWKIQDFCPKPTEQIDACEEHPGRKIWAQRQCGILKSDVFKQCHSEVPVDKFIKRCTYDTCACDQGGDCECLCTALSAYAHACAIKGVSIKWRTPDLCPMQCDPHCSSYSPCVDSCPVETCDNVLDQAKEQRLCTDDTCVEGCQIKPCPSDQIYSNDSFSECIPKSICKHICLEIDGVTYYEGDLIETDDCHTCRCTRGKKLCKGEPCTTIATTVSTTFKPYRDVEDVCKSGWSAWINQDKSDDNLSPNNLKIGDKEPLPSNFLLKNIPHSSTCAPEFIKQVECRTVGTHLDPKLTGENVECSLEQGLLGIGPCHDYEIRVFCDCGDEIEIFTLPTTQPHIVFGSTPWKLIQQTTLPPKILNNKCDPTIPHVEFPGDCYKFLHCQPAIDGSWQFVEKTCGPTMMFNPTAMVCDWIASVVAMKPHCGEPVAVSKCPPDQVWSDCAIPCGRSCHYYGKTLRNIGSCSYSSNDCEEGCIESTSVISCPAGKLWRDNKLCVGLANCPCMSNDGYFVKPGDTYKESLCEMCQCIDNSYICDKSACGLPQKLSENITYTEKPKLSTTTTKKPKLIILPSTITPPINCAADKLVPMVEGSNPLSDDAFGSSSYLGSSFKPEFSRLNSKPNEFSSGSWSPEINDQMQYLQIAFKKPEPLFGVIIRGSPIFDQYVTSFKILHSFDGIAFHYLIDETKLPQIFSGCIDSRTPVKTLFKIPIESKVIRIYPLTWHGSIAIRVELLGCGKDVPKITTPIIKSTTTVAPIVYETTTYIEIPAKPLCDDYMGIDSGLMQPHQVKVSSSKTHFATKPIDLLKLSSANGWMPVIDSPNEFVQFDFQEPRYLSGIKTKGGEYGWVSAFKVLYSPDNLIWNVMQDLDGQTIIFPANYDSFSVKSNIFQTTIQARYLKIVPTKWFNAIELKIEPLGCFKPYLKVSENLEIFTTPAQSLQTNADCGECPGILYTSPQVENTCNCYLPQFWNGQECVDRFECPCLVGHIQYNIGSKFELDDCSQCLCVLGGQSQCQPQQCPPCQKGLRPIKSSTCVCLCEPCPLNEVLCPSSGACIPEKLWCNGIEDCPDDEIDCGQKEKESPKIVTKVEEKITIIKTCPEPKCPPGFTIKEKKKESKISPMFQQSIKTETKSKSYTKSAAIGVKNKPANHYNSVLPMPEQINDKYPEECIEFICIPEKPIVEERPPQFVEEIICPEPTCPKGYESVIDNNIDIGVKCAKYSCVTVAKNDVVCNVTGRTFNTFDDVEFKYDICNHLLARDLLGDKWSVTIIKNCTQGNYICNKELIIVDKESDVVVKLFKDLTLNLDGYDYTVDQLQKSKVAKMKSFVISKVGNTIVFVSHLHGFWVTFDDLGDVKIGLSAIKYNSKVDGLCGFFNANPLDDKRLPDGKPALSTVEFGDGWFVNDDIDKSKENCAPHACPKDLQDKAWEMCNQIKHETFKACANVVDIDKYLSKCLETACDCLKMAENTSINTDTQKCKCSVLQSYVTDCLSTDENIQLDMWRTVHDCEATCPSPLQHKDCYRRRCELSCDTLSTDDCPFLPGTCFSGCYCPEGMVKKGEECVPVSKCKDCVCDGYGKSQYVTYDRKNFTFDGNCTYLLSRDLLVQNVHTFQVYVTLGPCDKDPNLNKKSVKTSCTQSLHILYGPHIIHLQKGPQNTIKILVDGIEVTSVPLRKDWISVDDYLSKEIKITLPESQIELSASFADMAFSIRVPSIKYGFKMEGLCGNCNDDSDDDLQVNPKKKIPHKDASFNDIIQSWLADEPKLDKEENCISPEEAEMDCIPLPPEQDPCLEIVDQDIFGQCHLIVDPYMYLSLCQQDMCKTGADQQGACSHLAAYAKECTRNLICVDWQKGLCKDDTKCPSDMKFDACGCPETCETIKEKKKILGGPKKVTANSTICSEPRTAGCFCPPGKIAHQNKCILENQCEPCDDKEHFVGDIWHPDKCTTCECTADSKTICNKKECAVIGNICEVDWKEVIEHNDSECCPTYKCVFEPIQTTVLPCPDLIVPKCGLDQYNKIITDSNGCSKSICECVPFILCKPLQFKDLLAGEKYITDTTGCCPVHKIICDKTKCPEKPSRCEEEFYEVIELPANDSLCCAEYQCKPPKDKCIIELGDKKYLKNINEKWPIVKDPCLEQQCVYGPDGWTTVLDVLETCETTSCQPGFKLQTDKDKCCGLCIQSECIVDNLIYKPGQRWVSADNCTTFNCHEINGQFVVNSAFETCPDISECPVEQRYNKGCCQYCKEKPESQKNCLATSLKESETVKMVEKPTKLHGLCRNIKPIRGFTECNGACSSGTKYNKLNYKQTRKCECCSVESYDNITVDLKCDDGFALDLVISVPKSCACQPCEEDASADNRVDKSLKTVKSSALKYSPIIQ